MDVTIVPATESLLSRLRVRFSSLSFQEGDDFHWSPAEKRIYYVQDDPLFAQRLLHEVSHSELEHVSYSRDVELIAMERDAWGYAKTTLGAIFGITVDRHTIEDDLDTYRDWLHARSTCPSCTATGVQTSAKEYTCIACRAIWTVNTAIGCDLRRYITKKRAE